MKRKYFSSAAAFLTAMSLAAGSASVSASAEDAMKFVAIGDSITAGYSPDDTLAASYAEMVSSYYGGELVSFAQNGLTSAGLLEQLSDPTVQSEIASADVVFVTIGGNDILHMVLNNDYIDAAQYDSMDALIAALKTSTGEPNYDILTPLNIYFMKSMPTVIKECRANIAAIAEQLKSVTDAQIVFQTVYNPMDCDADDTALAVSGSMEMLSNNVNKFLEGVENNTAFPIGQCVNGAIRDLTDVTVVDSFQLMYDHGYYYTRIDDVDVHPNNAGHLVMAESIIQALGISETGSENGTKLRAAYTADGAENTLSGVNAALDESIRSRVLRNSYGDTDANGSVDLNDAADALSIYAANGAGAEPPVTGVNAEAADGNQDGSVDLDDAALMLGYYAERGAECFSGTFMEYAAGKK